MLHVGYGRVSREEQAFEQSLRMQVERLQQSGCDRVFADIGSRDNDDRKGLQQIIKMIESGEVATIRVTRLDRLTSSPGLFERLTKLLHSKNISLLALDEMVDVHSVDGEFAAGLQVYFSQREVKTIRLRVKKSYEHRRSKSKANTSTPWGYRNHEGRYVLDHTPFICLLSDRPIEGEFAGRTKSQLAREIVEIFLECQTAGMTCKKIHERYGILKFKHPKAERNLMVFDKDDAFEYKRTKEPRAGVFRWNPDGVRRWLKNPVLRGHTPYKLRLPKSNSLLPQDQWDIRYNTHPDQRLLTDEQSRRIEEALALSKTCRSCGSFKSKGNRNTFIGILKCARCGRNMRCQGVKNYGEKYYQCRSYIEERSCDAKKMVRESVVMSAVVQELVLAAEKLAHFATTEEEIVEPPEIFQLRQQLSGLNALGHNFALEEAKLKIRQQIDKWRLQEEAKIQSQSSNKDLLIWAFSDAECWLKLDKKLQQQVIRDLVEEIKSVDGKVIAVTLKV